MGKQTANKLSGTSKPARRQRKQMNSPGRTQTKNPLNFLAVRPAFDRIEDERRDESRVVDRKFGYKPLLQRTALIVFLEKASGRLLTALV
jgi:hypothetical protein